ncbi:MAG: DUF5671 domain-containing protein [Acidimicrobiia bacterium]
MIAILGLLPLALLAGLIAGIAALSKRNDEEPPDGLVRRLVVAAITFGMTVVTVVGVGMLLDIALAGGDDLARSGSSDIAQALAMLMVGAPASYFLWRYQLRALAGPDGRSIVWLLYQMIASLTFSIGAVVSLGNGLRFHEFDASVRSALAFGIAWMGGWIFHELIRRRRPAPILPGLAQAIGGGVGLITLTFGAVSLIGALLDLGDQDFLFSSGRWEPVLDAIVWTVVGAAAWFWQFFTARTSDDLSRAGLVLGLGVGGGTLLGLGSLATGLAALLIGITDEVDTDMLSDAVAGVAVGFLVWRYHHTLVTDSQGIRIARHLTAGLALIGMAIGIGVLVNAALAALTPAFASANEDELLWGGLAAFVASAPVWWLTWKPQRQADADAGTPVQRVYLTVLGGVAGVSGAIALIYLLFQLLEGIFDGDSLAAIIDGIRAPFGFVASTGLVTAYHYRRWATTRGEPVETEPVTVERITFVGSDQALADSLRDDLGVRTTRWASAGEGRVLTADELSSHLRTLDATDVLIVEEERGYRVIRLLRDGQRPQSGEPQE